VAPAHTEFFGGIEGVARAKGELFATMRPDAVAIVNLDDPRVREMPRRPGRAVTYGSDASDRPDVLLERAQETQGGQRITLRAGGESVVASLSLPGAHNALNATAAIAASLACGVPVERAARGLASVGPVQGRGALVSGRRLSVIDDTYNANPASVRAGLELLRGLARGRRTVAVIGDMLELGDEAALLHAQVGERAASSGVGVLVAVGDHADDLRSGAVGAGMRPPAVVTFASTEAAMERIGDLMVEGDVVLVKGSRGMKMERVVDTLLYW
jgi:UDP-N-acetylmuramoyl-tripeptide--D-alanyl-D-alanine ligase